MNSLSVRGNLLMCPSPKVKSIKVARSLVFSNGGYDAGIKPFSLACCLHLAKLSILFLASEIFFRPGCVSFVCPASHGGGLFFKLSLHFLYLGSDFGKRLGRTLKGLGLGISQLYHLDDTGKWVIPKIELD